MAIKAIINNTEKEIEQIKNSDEQDIDYIYSRIGDTEVEGESSISIKSIGGNLSNYRIYGNTVGGESVGDLVENGEHAGEYKVPVTVEGKNLFDESKTANILKCYLSVSTLVSNVSTRTIFIECKPSTTYTVSKIRGERFVVGWSDKLPAPSVELQEKVINYNASSITITTGLTAKYLVAYIYNAEQDAPITADEMIASAQIEKGSTATPYEPYHAPVTTNLYLPEPIKMVGDEAEYVDYKEQKLHRVRKNLLQNTATSQTINGITFTVNADKSITCNGTATDTTYITVKNNVVLESGKYVLTGCPLDGGKNTFKLYAQTAFAAKFYVDEGAGAIIDYKSKITILITILSGYTCNNVIFYPMIRKADIEDNTYEPYIENTDLDVTLPALPTIKGTNTLSVNTSIQPSNIYVKDNFDYKRIFTATRAIEDELPLNYKNIEDNDSTLKSYRIYGNTIDGESVGDRTGNLFDEFSVHGMVPSVSTGELTNSPSGGATTDLIPIINGDITLSKSNAVQSNMYIFLYAQDKSYVGYTQTMVADTLILYGNSINGYQNAKYARIRVDIESAYTQTNIMLNEGSTALPYEPYGYKVPVTVEGKNLLPNIATSLTSRGVTFTVNADGSVTCDGTASNDNNAYLILARVPNFGAGTYILTGCPDGGSVDTYSIQYSNNVDKAPTDIGSGTNISQFDYELYPKSEVRIRIASGYTCNNLTFYPMIRKADISDDTYEPYHAPVTTPIYLPEQIKMVGDEAEYVDYGQQKQHRVRKNLWSGVVEQGGVSIYGDYVSNTKRIRSKNVPLEPGTYAISTNLLLLVIYAFNDTQKIGLCASIYQGSYSYTITVPAGANNISIGMMKVVDGVQVDITPSDFEWGQVEKGSEVTNYEPYIENTDLDVTLPALPTLSGTNTLSVGTEVQPSRVYLKGKIKEIN